MEEVIAQLKDTSPGHDDIHVKVIKIISSIISPILSKLINNSFITGHFPCTYKTAKVIPIHKGGDKQHPSDYNPKLILTMITKITEKVVYYTRLIIFPDHNNILANNQFGF